MSALILPREAFVYGGDCTGSRVDPYHLYCMRPIGHCGRHAWISPTGAVRAVWGEDVHADARARGRARLQFERRWLAAGGRLTVLAYHRGRQPVEWTHWDALDESHIVRGES